MISNYIALVAFIVMHITGHEILLDGISEMQIRKTRNVLEAIGMVFLEQSRINYNDFYSNSNVPTGSGYLISRYLSNSNDELTVWKNVEIKLKLFLSSAHWFNNADPRL